MKKVFHTLVVVIALLDTSCRKKEVKDVETESASEISSNASDGVTYYNNGSSAIFNLYAPGKSTIAVIGDFNNWKADSRYQMKKTADGKRWWLQVDGLDPDKEYGYQYLIDNSLRIADPYTEKVLDQDNDKFISSAIYPNLKAYPKEYTSGVVSVMQGNRSIYNWKTVSFTRPERKNLVIYELHIRDFVSSHDFNALKDTLSYIKRLGVNAIELMPVNEFEGNLSWGYNPSFYFAPDKYYGTKDALKAFIDECHSLGIAVILDMVLNHSFGQSPLVQMYFNKSTGKVTADNPWFNTDPTHPFNVGHDFNHESEATKYFSKKVMEFWMKEYRIDGFRFDLSKGFTQKKSGTDVNVWTAYDASRVAIWKNYNNYIKSIDPNFFVILEHFGSNQEERELADEGMMFWNNGNHNFNEATMGWLNDSNFAGQFYPTHTFTQPGYLVSFMESHDEERLMYKNLQYGNSSGSYSVKDLPTALKRNEMAAAFFFSIPGPKMIWQFGELGYDVSIDYNGRTGEKPIRWEYYSDPKRKALYNAYAKFIRMKLNNPVFGSGTFEYSLIGAIKSLRIWDREMQVLVVGNFDVVPLTANLAFPSTGAWFDYVSGKTINITSTTLSISYAPGEYHMYSNVPLKE
ncbi:alpha-amylase family glycosyl hydrolase [Desertivirga brevis]|uniref:alpha-amylase family glycosyl hydrolase n=1 Tax=Desertivirga brevis TaxID=2810310 RepID=UPI001A97824A|nr:alpha-amylase family glycosyl hydrolase [Pedobacter sp. SYSU D00873]